MALRKKVQNFNKIIETYKMKVNQKRMDALHRPSFFQSLNSKMSCPINDLPQIESYITLDTSIKGFTEAYRKRLAIGKKCADARSKEAGSQITYLEVGNDLFTN